ncbi:hypothetical protein GQ473_02350 [archaeon]|nr:hypothetical protein [archaeon]
MTTVENNTFTGPNAGIVEGYVPLTTIESTSMDGDLNLVKDDLNYHLSILQAIYTKLDTIETGATATPSVSIMVSAINASAELIDADNLESTVALLSNIISYIEVHRVTTTQSAMHPEDSIKSTDQTYSYTPSSIITSCQNILDEINNLRYQIAAIVGKSTWIDTPDSTIATMQSTLSKVEYTKNVIIKVFPDTLTLTAGDAKGHFTVPIELNGMNLVSVGAHVYTSSSSGLPTFNIYNLTDTVDMLSTPITIDVSTTDSSTATIPAIIDTTYDDITTADVLRIDCDIVGTDTKGLEIRMGFRSP